MAIVAKEEANEQLLREKLALEEGLKDATTERAKLEGKMEMAELYVAQLKKEEQDQLAYQLADATFDALKAKERRDELACQLAEEQQKALKMKEEKDQLAYQLAEVKMDKFRLEAHNKELQASFEAYKEQMEREQKELAAENAYLKGQLGEFEKSHLAANKKLQAQEEAFGQERIGLQEQNSTLQADLDRLGGEFDAYSNLMEKEREEKNVACKKAVEEAVEEAQRGLGMENTTLQNRIK